MALAFEDVFSGRFLAEGSDGVGTLVSLVVLRSGDLSAAAYEWTIIPDSIFISGPLVDGDDFEDPLSELPSGVLIFEEGADSASFSFQLRDDILPEQDAEGFLVVVSDPGGDPEEITKQFYINDNDRPFITLAAEPQVQQGNTVFNGLVQEDAQQALTFRFELSTPSNQPLTIFFALSDVSVTPVAAGGFSVRALSPALLSAGKDAITLQPGQLSAALEVVPQPDGIDEPDQILQLRISADTAYLNAPTISGTIRDDDEPALPSVSLAIAPAAVAEDGASSLVYTFRRSGSLASALTVKYSVAGTALAVANGADPADYSGLPASGSDGLRQITIPAGAATATLQLTPIVDARVEDEETVQLTLAAAAGYTLGSPSSATGRISNDDALVSLAVAPAAVLEDGDQALTFTFRRSGAIGRQLTVLYTVSGRARLLPGSGDPADYSGIPPVAGPQQLVLPAGVASASVVLDPIADSRPEPDESLTLTLLPGSGYGLGATRAITGAILNDDATIRLSVAPAAVAEDGSRPLVYTFRRSGALATPLLVNVTLSGTAAAVAGINDPADYRLLGATGNGRQVLFAAGATVATLFVDPTADNRVEPDETVTLSLAPGAGYGFAAGTSATGTITGDDANVSVRVTPDAILEDGSDALIYTFRRTGPLGRPLAVDYRISGSATVIASSNDPSDVRGLPVSSLERRVRFAIGEASVRLPVRATPDRRPEADETLVLSVLPGAGYKPAATAATATGVIRNDDPSSVVVASPAPIVIPDRGTASPYPSSLRIDGLTGSLVDVSVNLFGIRHPSPEDLDILLLNPAGQAVMLLSDTGRSFDLRGVDLRFTQQASSTLPQGLAIGSGTFQPTDHGLARDVLPAPAPAGPFGHDLSLFRGGAVNGEWRLLVFDDARTNAGNGAISGGWSLTLSTL
ncbi:MAG: Calx-beta domain-containing protein [Cyanobium sp.]